MKYKTKFIDVVKIYFRKILRYDPTFGGLYGKYDGYKKIVLQELDPDIELSNEYSIDLPGDLSLPVFTSSLKRAVETAEKYFESEKILSLDELKEVKFDLGLLLSNTEYQQYGSSLVRKRFMEAFINDSLFEKRNQIKSRILKLMDNFSKLDSGNYLVISHSFFMKLFQIYLFDNNIFDNPRLIKKYFDPDERTFNFGEGFEFQI